MPSGSDGRTGGPTYRPTAIVKHLRWLKTGGSAHVYLPALEEPHDDDVMGQGDRVVIELNIENESKHKPNI